MTDKSISATRRSLLTAVGIGTAGAILAEAPRSAAAAASSRSAPNANAYQTALTLVGTAGGPPPWSGRSGICSAVRVGDKTYLVDLGHGAFEGIHKAGITADSIRAVFVTHLHSDHFADAYQLFWLRHGGLRRLRGPVHLFGPGQAGALPPAYPAGRAVPTVNPAHPTPGTVDFVHSSLAATAYDLNLRMRDEGWPDIRSVLVPHDIEVPHSGASPDNPSPEMDPFVVFEDGTVRVTATLVSHPPVFPAFAYRVETEAGAIVFSGDTTRNNNLVRIAKDADVLVHEAIAPEWVANSGVSPELAAHIIGSHTSIDEVGAIAESAGVRTLVISHMAPADPMEMSDGQWARRAKQGFSGKVLIGHDLDEIGIGTSRR